LCTEGAVWPGAKRYWTKVAQRTYAHAGLGIVPIDTHSLLWVEHWAYTEGLSSII